MSTFPSFLHASKQIEELGYQRLGSSLGGITDKAYWFSPEFEMVAEGKELWGSNDYQITIRDATKWLYPALYAIKRSEHPQWSMPECQEAAKRWCSLLGYSPLFQEAA